jgi:hypothetical protein
MADLLLAGAGLLAVKWAYERQRNPAIEEDMEERELEEVELHSFGRISLPPNYRGLSEARTVQEDYDRLYKRAYEHNQRVGNLAPVSKFFRFNITNLGPDSMFMTPEYLARSEAIHRSLNLFPKHPSAFVLTDDMSTTAAPPSTHHIPSRQSLKS